MEFQVISSFVVMAAALFIGSRRSGLTIDNNQIEKEPESSSPEKVVEDYYYAYLQKEGCEEHLEAQEEASEHQAASGTKPTHREWAWPVMTPDRSRPRGIMVENARIDGNRAIVPVRAGYLGPAGDMDFRLKFGVLMEKIDGHWQIAGTYNK